MAEEYKKDLREQMQSFTRKKEEEFTKKAAEISQKQQQQEQFYEQQKQQQAKLFEEQKQKTAQQFQQKLEEEKKQLQRVLEENLRKSISSDFENKLQMLDQSNKESEEKLKLARAKELDFLKKEQLMKSKGRRNGIRDPKKTSGATGRNG